MGNGSKHILHSTFPLFFLISLKTYLLLLPVCGSVGWFSLLPGLSLLLQPTELPWFLHFKNKKKIIHTNQCSRTYIGPTSTQRQFWTIFEVFPCYLQYSLKFKLINYLKTKPNGNNSFWGIIQTNIASVSLYNTMCIIIWTHNKFNTKHGAHDKTCIDFKLCIPTYIDQTINKIKICTHINMLTDFCSSTFHGKLCNRIIQIEYTQWE